MKYLFTSDTHFDHANIIKYCNRPFKTAFEMTEGLIKNWNEKVDEEDEIFHIGDFAFSPEPRIHEILRQLKGKIHLIVGNHDNKRSFYGKVAGVHDYLEIRIPDITAKAGRRHISLLHFPMRVWNRSHHGSWHLHGHCHGTIPEDMKSYILDVGVDCNNMYPFTFDEIKQRMEKKMITTPELKKAKYGERQEYKHNDK